MPIGTVDRVKPQLRYHQARLAVSGYFVLNAIIFSVFAIRIPALKHQLGLSDGTLGAAMSAMTIGSLVVLPLVGRLTERFGFRVVLVVVAAAEPVALVFIGLAHDLAVLVAVLLVFGALNGVFDVAMNAEASRVEEATGRPLMSSFHACFSIAELVGVGAGSLLTVEGVSLAGGSALIAVPLVLGGLVAARMLKGFVPGAPTAFQTSAEAGGRRPFERRSVASTIWLLAALALCGQIIESVTASWSGVYVRDDLGSSAIWAAGSYAAFAIAMALGRLFGNRVTARYGPTRLVRVSTLVAGVGFAAGLLAGSPIGSAVGFAFLGAGMSCVIPSIYAAVGRFDPSRSGSHISLVVGVSYAGLLGGPPLIGGLANLIGLRGALGVPVILALIISMAAGAISQKEGT